MIDLKLLRDDPERFRTSLRRRGSNVDIDELIALDLRRRGLLVEVEEGRARQNRLNRGISDAKGAERERMIPEARLLSEELEQKEAALQEAGEEMDSLLSEVPNLVHPDVPDGTSDDDNRVLREVGDRRTFDFAAQDHLTIGESLDVIDTSRASKVSGTRFGYLKGQAALLELALVRFALDRALSEGFRPVVPPVLVREEVLFGMGFFPASRDEAYEIPRDDLFLVGTSEAPLAGLHMDEILEDPDLPTRYAGFSTCFRREAGTYGRDTRGIIRVHQFDKVELFVYCTPDTSEEEHERILSIEESIFQGLDVPYRVVDVCAGELGAPYYRKFDIEAWLPGDQRWLEVTSCSNALDYQSRRLRIRHRAESGNQYVHTLNGTAVAIGRAVVALFENHQQADGTVTVPEALRSFTGFETIKG